MDRPWTSVGQTADIVPKVQGGGYRRRRADHTFTIAIGGAGLGRGETVGKLRVNLACDVWQSCGRAKRLCRFQVADAVLDYAESALKLNG